MSSINPVFLLGGALANRAGDLGRAFVSSLTLGSGQFCTNPGLVIAVDGPDLDTFIAAAREALSETAPSAMLTPGIAESYRTGVDALAQEADLIARGSTATHPPFPAAPRCSAPTRRASSSQRVCRPRCSARPR